jgi:hypothetical protein
MNGSQSTYYTSCVRYALRSSICSSRFCIYRPAHVISLFGFLTFGESDSIPLAAQQIRDLQHNDLRTVDKAVPGIDRCSAIDTARRTATALAYAIVSKSKVCCLCLISFLRLRHLQTPETWHCLCPSCSESSSSLHKQSSRCLVHSLAPLGPCKGPNAGPTLAYIS